MIKITETYEICYPNPLSLKVGDSIQLFAKESPEKWRDWKWCKDSAGNEGWISETYFERTLRDEATVVRDYSARELSVRAGDEVELIFTDCGWSWCRKAGGTEGWLPTEILDESALPFRTYGLSHLQITVLDLERSLRFYRELLGMREIRRLGDHAAMIQTPGSHEIVTINANPEDAHSAGNMGGIAHFGFRLREPVEMAKVLERVTELGGKPISHGASQKGDRLYAFATDPDGYEVELFWEEN